MNLLLMADQQVGKEIIQWILDNYKEDLVLVVTTEQNEIYSIVHKAGIPCLKFETIDQVCSYILDSGIEVDFGLLAWWPKLITQLLLDIPGKGFINTHPSLLPYNRGRHYNFWALVEQVPFGVSLHFVTVGIDDGDIVAQTSIPYDWEDNGATLYTKANQAMLNLFKETYPNLREFTIHPVPQDLTQGSLHYAKELEPASTIDIDAEYKARDLLNVLRARTFFGYPACSFIDDDVEYEVRVEIKRKIK